MSLISCCLERLDLSWGANKALDLSKRFTALSSAFKSLFKSEEEDVTDSESRLISKIATAFAAISSGKPDLLHKP